MTARSYLASGGALALALVLAASGTAHASTKKPKHKAVASSFTVSGQISGTLSFNKSESCQADNSSVAAGLYTVRVYLSDHKVQPTKATWALVLEAKVGRTPYPAVYPDELTLSVTSPTETPISGDVERGGVEHADRIRLPHTRSKSEGRQPHQHGALSGPS